MTSSSSSKDAKRINYNGDATTISVVSVLRAPTKDELRDTYECAVRLRDRLALRCDYVETSAEQSSTSTRCNDAAFYAPVNLANGRRPIAAATRCRPHAPIEWRYAYRPKTCMGYGDELGRCDAPSRWGFRWLQPCLCERHATQYNDDVEYLDLPHTRAALCIYVCMLCRTAHSVYGYVDKHAMFCRNCVTDADAIMKSIGVTEALRNVNTHNCPGIEAFVAGEPDATPCSTDGSGDVNYASINSSSHVRVYGIGGKLKATHCQAHAPAATHARSRRTCAVPNCHRKPHYGADVALLPTATGSVDGKINDDDSAQSSWLATSTTCDMHQYEGDIDRRHVELCTSCRAVSVSCQPTNVCNICARYVRCDASQPCGYVDAFSGSKQIAAFLGVSHVEREVRIVRTLHSAGITVMSRDKSLLGVDGTCRSRPDIIIPSRLRTHYIIIEVDEHAHSGKSQLKETKRVDDVMRQSDRKVFVLRFNPDRYTPPRDALVIDCYGNLPLDQLPTYAESVAVLIGMVQALYEGDGEAFHAIRRQHSKYVLTTRFESVPTYAVPPKRKQDARNDRKRSKRRVEGDDMATHGVQLQMTSGAAKVRQVYYMYYALNYAP